MSKEKLNLLAGLEIGTNKVALSLACIEDEQINVMAISQAPHRGVHQGQIVDTTTISHAIQKVKSDVEATSGQAISSVYMSVADISAETIFSKAVVSIRREVTRKDVEAAIKMAQEGAQLRRDREILHVCPQYYKVDGFKFNEAPLGHKGSSLEVATMILTANKKNIDVARDCAQAQGLYVRDVVSSSFASAYGVTNVTEREQGVAVVDIGSSMTDIIVFREKQPQFVTALPIGGLNFTQDLAVGLRTPQAAAELIKKSHGSALVDMVSDGENLEVPSLKGEEPRLFAKKFVCEILEARAEETLGLILKKLNDENLLFYLQAGVLLTGGGSLLPGLTELGKYTFDIPLKRGLPKELAGLGQLNQGPGLSTSLGLLQYARERHSFEPMELSIDTFKSKWGQLKNLIDNIL